MIGWRSRAPGALPLFAFVSAAVARAALPAAVAGAALPAAVAGPALPASVAGSALPAASGAALPAAVAGAALAAAVVIGALLAAAGGALAAQPGVASDPARPERWVAVSRTATAITGDVTYAPGSLTFFDGSVAHLRRERLFRTALWAGQPTHGQPVSLFRVARFGNGRMRSGNRLCDAPPTYLSIVRVPDGRATDVQLAVYSDAAPPASAGLGREPCATYAYEIDTRP